MGKHEELGRGLRAGIRVVVWLLLPLILGLVLVLALLLASFYSALIGGVMGLSPDERYGVILLVLDLLDTLFVAHLVVMTAVGFYNSYFRPSGRSGELEDAGIGFAGGLEAMKSHFAVVLVIISGIHLLHEVLQGEVGDPWRLLGLAAVHLVLLVTAVALVWIARDTR